MKHSFLFSPVLLVLLSACSGSNTQPTESISAEVIVNQGDGHASLVLTHDRTFAEVTSLGLITPLDSTSVWTLASQSQPVAVAEDYEMLIGKRLHCTNHGYQTDYLLTDGQGHAQRLEVRTYADGVAFRYVLCEGYEEPQTLLGEHTVLQVGNTDECRRWLMRWSDSYEGFYMLNPEDNDNQHWGFPALFNPKNQNDDFYFLLTEAGVEKGHAAAAYYTTDGGYHIQNDRMESLVSTGWATPWRVLIAGGLNDVITSTLVTDLSPATNYEDLSWIEPGVVSWIYWAYNHGSNNYDIICQYIDMAKELKLPYMLIDAEWDEMPTHSAGHQNIEDALAYARENGVKPMIWYNSSIGWIDGAPTPKFRLNDPELREKEFQWCEEQGVAGVKIDFFSGDDERCMNYCIDLLESAARHHLLVNFHGATVPRGWMRTYPNLLSTEAVYGAEWYNNRPVLTPRAAAHNATIPFTRGVIGSMDYTPCTFTDSQHPHITSHAHELALTVLFESGLQHLADRPSAYLSQPEVIQNFFSTLPTVWDETQLISGEVGHHVVLLRRQGTDIYVAGINGTDEPLTLDLSELAQYITLPEQVEDEEAVAPILLIEDNPNALFPTPVENEAERWHISTTDALPTTIALAPRGGFILTIR